MKFPSCTLLCPLHHDVASRCISRPANRDFIRAFLLVTLLFVFRGSVFGNASDPPVTLSPGSMEEEKSPEVTLPILMEWQDVGSDVLYGLYVRDLSEDRLVYNNDRLDKSSSLVMPGNLFKPGNSYRWNMRVYREGEWSEFSPRRYFRIVKAELPTPKPLKPGVEDSRGEEIKLEGTDFSWTKVEGAIGYGLYVSVAPFGPDYLIINRDDLPAKTHFEARASDFSPGTYYRWNVRAQFKEGWGGFSEHHYFYTASGRDEPPPSVDNTREDKPERTSYLANLPANEEDLKARIIPKGRPITYGFGERVRFYYDKSGGVITSNKESVELLPRNSYHTEKVVMHAGVDFPANPGDFIFAYDTGVVEKIIKNKTDEHYEYLGFALILRHDHIKNREGVALRSVYLHLNASPARGKDGGKLLKVEDKVDAGDPIGQAGELGTGDGVHLHFELRFFSEFLHSEWRNIYGGKYQNMNSPAFKETFQRDWVNPLNPHDSTSFLPSPPFASQASSGTRLSSENLMLRKPRISQLGEPDPTKNTGTSLPGLSSEQGRVLLIPNENTSASGDSSSASSSSPKASATLASTEDILDVQKRLKRMLSEPAETKNPPNGKDDDHDGMIDEGYAHQTSFYIMDNGNISDDEFFITIGSHKSPTVPAGSILQWGINLSAGKHVLKIHCVKAPDNQGTYMIWGAGNATLNQSGVIGNGESEEIHFWVR